LTTERNALWQRFASAWQTKTGEHTAWVADYFSPGPDGKRQRHGKTFKTRKEATAWLAQTTVEIRHGVHTPAHRSPTVIEAGEHWIAQAAADGLERATIAQYRQHLDFHIKPFLGLHKLAELTPAAVQSFRNVLVRQGRSRVMAGKVITSLGSILAEAMAGGRVSRNVVREQARHDRRRARVEKRHTKRLQVGVDLPTKDELRAMLAHAGGLRPLLVTAVFTGLRASELRGLTWDAVEFDRRVLTVRQRADRWGTIGSPKSDSGKREVPLAPIVVNTLREWRLACPNGAMNLVFPKRRQRRFAAQHSPARARSRAARRRPHRGPGAPEIWPALTAAHRGEPVHRTGVLAQARAGLDGAFVDRDDLRRLWPPVPVGRRRPGRDGPVAGAADRVKRMADPAVRFNEAGQ
jgi:integrase